MITIVYQNPRKNYSDITIGEFFKWGDTLFFKYSITHAYDFTAKDIREFKDWDIVDPADVEIKVN